MMRTKKPKTNEVLSQTAIETLGREQHLKLIAQHGLRDAVRIVRDLHARIEATLQEQIKRYPAEWPEYAVKPTSTIAAQPQEKRSLPIPQVRG